MEHVILKFMYLLLLIAHIHTHEDEFDRFEDDEQLEIRSVWRYHGNMTIHYSKKLSGKKFVFAICNNEQLPFKMACDLVMTLMEDDSHIPPNVTCNIEFVPEDGHQFMGNRSDPQRVTLDYLEGSGKPMIIWDEVHTENQQLAYKSISTVNMTTCEPSTSRIKMPLDDSGEFIDKTFELLVFEDRFDVIISKSEKCPGIEWCRISYNEVGQQIGEPRVFPLDLLSLNLTLTQPLCKFGDVYAYGVSNVGNGSALVAYQVMLDEVTKLDTYITSDNDKISPMVSTTNDMFLICGFYPETVWTNTIIRCNQYANGPIEPSFDFETYTIDSVVSVSNLADKKVLIFATDLIESSMFELSVYEMRENNTLGVRNLSTETAFPRWGNYKDFTYVIQNEKGSTDEESTKTCLYFAKSYFSDDFDLGILMHEKFCLKRHL